MRQQKMKEVKRILSIMMCYIMLTSIVVPHFSIVAHAQDEQRDVTESCTTEVCIVNAWEGGYQADVIITNTGSETISDWKLDFNTEDTVTDMWNGSVVLSENGAYTIVSADWNSEINPGESVSLGYTATYVWG